MESNDYTFQIEQQQQQQQELRWLTTDDDTSVNLNGSFVFDHIFFQTPQVAREMAGSKRFGHSNNFAALFSGQEEANDYIEGLVWLGVFFGLLFFLWICAIIIFCFFGKKKAGFLSGKPFERKHYYSNANTGLSNNENNVRASITADNNSNNSVKPEAPFEQSMTPNNKYEMNDGVSASPETPRSMTSHNSNTGSTNSAYYSNDNVGASNKDNYAPYEMQDGVSSESQSMINNNNNQRNSSYHRHSLTSSQQHIIDNNINTDPTCCNIDRIIWVRSVFIVSGITFMLFSWLFVVLGLTNAQSTVDTLNLSAEDIAGLTGEGAAILQNVTNELNNTTNVLITSVINQLSNASTLCPNNPSMTGNPTIEFFGNITSLIARQLEKLQGIESTFNLDSTINALQRNEQQANDLYNATVNISLADWQSLLAIIPGCIVTLLLITATMLAWNHDKRNKANVAVRSNNTKDHKYFSCMILWFILPFFIIIIGVSIATCIAVIVAAGANSDFCYPEQYTIDPNVVLPPNIVENLGNFTNAYIMNSNGQTFETPLNSPDVTALQILLNTGYNISSNDYFLVAFYIAQCTKENPWDFLEQYIPTVEAILEQVQELNATFNRSEFTLEIENQCGRNYTELVESIQAVERTVQFLLVSFFRLLNLIKCDSIVPIYQQVVYTGSCHYSVKAVIWMFSAALITSLSGLLMITFRSALYPTLYMDVYDGGMKESIGVEDNNNNNNNGSQDDDANNGSGPI